MQPIPTKTRINWQIVFFTFTRTVLNSGYRMVYPLLPLFASALGVELAAFATAFSIRSFLGIAAPFLAAYADTRSRKAGMLLGLGLFTLGVALVPIYPSFLTFIIASTLVVIGNGVFIPSMQAYLSDHIPFEKRGRVISITELSWGLGFVVGIPVLGALLTRFGWVAPFILLTAGGMILFGLLMKAIPSENQAQRSTDNMFVSLKRVVTYMPALAGLLMGLLFTSANEVVNLVFGVWIEDNFGLAFATLTAASVVIGTSELASELLSALILDKLGKKRSIIISLSLNCLAALILPLTVTHLGLALAGLAFFYITFEFALISTLTLMSEVLPKARATIIAATVAAFSLGRMLGDLIAPSLYSVSFWAACLTTIGLNLFALLFLIPLRRAGTPSSPQV